MIEVIIFDKLTLPLAIILLGFSYIVHELHETSHLLIFKFFILYQQGPNITNQSKLDFVTLFLCDTLTVDQSARMLIKTIIV